MTDTAQHLALFARMGKVSRALAVGDEWVARETLVCANVNLDAIERFIALTPPQGRPTDETVLWAAWRELRRDVARITRRGLRARGRDFFRLELPRVARAVAQIL